MILPEGSLNHFLNYKKIAAKTVFWNLWYLVVLIIQVDQPV